MLQPLKLIRLFANFGSITIAGGAIGYALALILARVCSIPEDFISHFVYSITIASTLGSAYLDSRFEITSSLLRRFWTNEIGRTYEQLSLGHIDYRQALERAIHAEYELSVPPSLLGRAFSRSIAKQVRDDKLWIVREVLPSVADTGRPGTQTRDLDYWKDVINELVEALYEARQERSLIAKLKGFFGSNSLIKAVKFKLDERRRRLGLITQELDLKEKVEKLKEAEAILRNKLEIMENEYSHTTEGSNQLVVNASEQSIEYNISATVGPEGMTPEESSPNIRTPLPTRVKN